MKKLLLALTAMAAFSAFTFIDAALPLGADIPKADVKMKDISGKEISFSEARAKNGLLVMFSCNTCPVVKAYQSRTKEICKYALDNGVGVILLNSNEGTRDGGDSYEDMKDYAKGQDYKWFYVEDKNSVMADAFGANRTPETFLFNKEGKLVYHGAIDNNQDEGNVSRVHLKEAINEMNGGKDVSVKESRSVGCSIKRKG